MAVKKKGQKESQEEAVAYGSKEEGSGEKSPKKSQEKTKGTL